MCLIERKDIEGIGDEDLVNYVDVGATCIISTKYISVDYKSTNWIAI